MVPDIVREYRQKIENTVPLGRVAPRHTESEHFYEDTTDGKVYRSVTTKLSIFQRPSYKQMAVDKAVNFLRDFIEENPQCTSEEFADALDTARNKHTSDLQQAGTWGTHGHDLVDLYLQDWIDNDERPQSSIRSFAWENISNEGVCVGLGAEKFFNDYDVFPIVSERKVISKKHSYAGTLDSLFFVGEIYHNQHGDVNCHHDWLNRNKTGTHIECRKCTRALRLTLTIVDWKSSNIIFSYAKKGAGKIKEKYEYAFQAVAYYLAFVEMTDVKAKEIWIVQLNKEKPGYTIGRVPDITKVKKHFLHANELSDFIDEKEECLVPLVAKEEPLNINNL